MCCNAQTLSAGNETRADNGAMANNSDGGDSLGDEKQDRQEESHMVRKENIVAVEHLGGGKGTAYVHHIVSKEELLGHGRMYAKVVLPPGTSVGWHQHVHDTEPYYILKGQADFIDNDKSVTKVGPGDCCLIEVGQFHSLENNSDEDVEFMALIYNEKGFLYE